MKIISYPVYPQAVRKSRLSQNVESQILAGERASKLEITYKGVISGPVCSYLDTAYKLGYIRGYIIEKVSADAKANANANARANASAGANVSAGNNAHTKSSIRLLLKA